MAVSFAQKVVVPLDVLVQELQGEAVLLNLNSGRYYGLDEVGSRMWVALTTSASVQAAYEVLLAEYDVEAERLRVDVQDLLEKLIEQGLVEVQDQ